MSLKWTRGSSASFSFEINGPAASWLSEHFTGAASQKVPGSQVHVSCLSLSSGAA